jgi:hypothetical protein
MRQRYDTGERGDRDLFLCSPFEMREAMEMLKGERR